MKTYLVTGSAGFIGFHLSKRLLEKGNKVIGVDNLNDYYDVTLKERRNEILKGYDNYLFEKIDIKNYESLKKIFVNNDFDMIIHLAAQAGVRYSIDNPFVYNDSNNTGTLNIFECARHNSVKRVIFASSSSVYGGNDKIPFSEEDNCERAVSLYAATKKANEVMAHAYHHLYGIEMAGLRFFTVYGEYGRPDMAVFKFPIALTNGEELKVYNNGEMKRDFTYIDDIIDGIEGVMGKDDLKFEIYNLGRGEPVDLMEYISLYEKYLGIEGNLKMWPMQQGDVKVTFADVLKAKEHFGYDPKVSIDEGVKRFCEWFKENEDWILMLDKPKQ